MSFKISRGLKLISLFGGMLLPVSLFGQIIIGSGVSMGSSGTPDVVIQASSDFTNNSSYDFAGTNLMLNLVGGDQQITGTLIVSDLNVDGGGTKHINRPMTITHGVNFKKGIVIPQSTLLYTGSSDDIQGGSETSFVNGRFSVRSNGRLTFPVGVPTFGYAPIFIEDGDDANDVTIQLVAAGAGLVPSASDLELVFIANTHYWEISTTHPDGVAGLNSRVTLSTSGSTLSSELGPVVVEATATNGEAVNLGRSSTSAGAVSSRVNISQPIVTVGGTAEIDLVIHDLITPFTKGDANDYLYIESIEKFDYNKVTLLDRWGVPVKEWKNFTNYDDPVTPNTDGYDFAKLSPGSYICVVEYGFSDGAKRKKSQMVTVLKAN